ncbi:hypothetical protein BaRGS_00019534 [Batillaria attramentaria]|uniref:Uncharacterized protein n=1 Tax=Batillaria attramentaria TaxID=370345 RepID=A0ABD0KQC3_9CAEN
MIATFVMLTQERQNQPMVGGGRNMGMGGYNPYNPYQRCKPLYYRCYSDWECCSGECDDYMRQCVYDNDWWWD